MTKKEPSINLNSMLSALDVRDRDWYNRLTPEQKKDWSSWLTMRYCSSVDHSTAITEHYLLCTNDFVNKNFSAIKKEHAELQWLSMCVVGIGKKSLHSFIRPPAAPKKNKLIAWVTEQWPTMSDEEVELMLSINSKETLRDVAEQLGMSPKEIKDLFN